MIIGLSQEIDHLKRPLAKEARSLREKEARAVYSASTVIAEAKSHSG
jgi:hypothetical protein